MQVHIVQRLLSEGIQCYNYVLASPPNTLVRVTVYAFCRCMLWAVPVVSWSEAKCTHKINILIACLIYSTFAVSYAFWCLPTRHTRIIKITITKTFYPSHNLCTPGDSWTRTLDKLFYSALYTVWPFDRWTIYSRTAYDFVRKLGLNSTQL